VRKKAFAGKPAASQNQIRSMTACGRRACARRGSQESCGKPESNQINDSLRQESVRKKAFAGKPAAGQNQISSMTACGRRAGARRRSQESLRQARIKSDQ
jgi:hypothetical protein